MIGRPSGHSDGRAGSEWELVQGSLLVPAAESLASGLPSLFSNLELKVREGILELWVPLPCQDLCRGLKVVCFPPPPPPSTHIHPAHTHRTLLSGRFNCPYILSVTSLPPEAASSLVTSDKALYEIKRQPCRFSFSTLPLLLLAMGSAHLGAKTLAPFVVRGQCAARSGLQLGLCLPHDWPVQC